MFPPPAQWISTRSEPQEWKSQSRVGCELAHLVDDVQAPASELVASFPLQSILLFWLDKGVDGFRISHAQLLYEDADLRNDTRLCDEEVSYGNILHVLITNFRSVNLSLQTYDCLEHVHSSNQPETHDLVAHWRALLNEYSDKTSQDRCIIDHCGFPGCDQAVNFSRFCILESSSLMLSQQSMKHWNITGLLVELALTFQWITIYGSLIREKMKTLGLLMSQGVLFMI